MKKNLTKVLALALVAIMLFACTSCTQTLLVRFVDADGNDIQIGGIGNADPTPEAPSSETPATEAPVSEAPSSEVPSGEVPSSEAPSGETPATEAPASDAPATQAPASDAPATQAPTTQAPASTIPTGTAAILEFYRNAANKVKGGAAGYVKKEWQSIGALNINPMIDGAVKGVVEGFMTKEDAAKDQVSAKGSDDAKNRFPACTLTDVSKIKSATCTKNAKGNYDIKIVMNQEDTPRKSGSTLGQITNSLMYWEDIEKELTSNATVTKILKSYKGVSVLYKDYTITCEITPDGKFVSMTHLGNVDIIVGEAKIVAVTVKDKSASLVNTCTYKNFQY